MVKFIVGDKLLQALYDAGIIGDDYTYIRRLIIDLEAGSVGRLYIEKFADNDSLTTALTAGLQIVETAAEAGPTGIMAPKPAEGVA